MMFHEWFVSFFSRLETITLSGKEVESYKDAYTAGHQQGYEDGYREALAQFNHVKKELSPCQAITTPSTVR
jgi:hypothetical protein